SQGARAKHRRKAVRAPMMKGRPAGCGGARTLRISSVMAIRRGVMEGWPGNRKADETGVSPDLGAPLWRNVRRATGPPASAALEPVSLAESSQDDFGGV